MQTRHEIALTDGFGLDASNGSELNPRSVARLTDSMTAGGRTSTGNNKRTGSVDCAFTHRRLPAPNARAMQACRR
jgi:hypothetical protein